jgi:hypothetical protein
LDCLGPQSRTPKSPLDLQLTAPTLNPNAAEHCTERVID